jgi:cytochrome c biogenesis protein CcmG, thiol:disulfide interchange protein DsbE
LRVRRRLLIGLAVAGLVAVVAIGISQAPRSSGGTAPPPSAADIRVALAGSPPALAALHAQADRLLPGGATAIAARLASVHGHPAVLNKWASWCGPCTREFPFFQHASVSFGRQVAFIGLDSADNRGDAAQFLKSYPVSYPSYVDPSGRAGIAVTKSTFFPVTVFYDSTGQVSFIHQGQYPTQAKLDQDIRRYAIGA